MIAIGNGDKRPAWAKPGPDDWDTVECCYHGTRAEAVLSIVENGFQPEVGTGSPYIGDYFFRSLEDGDPIEVPGIYVSADWSTAASYPQSMDARQHEVNAGTLLATDGTYPMRAVFRVLCRKNNRLYHTKSSKKYPQSMYRPEDLYITHVFFYAVPPANVNVKQTSPTVSIKMPDVVDSLNKEAFMFEVSQAIHGATRFAVRDSVNPPSHQQF
jgi:hypothetical protein